MRAVLVVNPQATATSPGGRDVLAHALASQVKLEVVETEHRGHAMTVARAAARGELGDVGLVVAHGGDGTVNEVVNGLMDGAGRAARYASGGLRDARDPSAHRDTAHDDTAHRDTARGDVGHRDLGHIVRPESPAGPGWTSPVPAPMLGVVPGGSANVFARALGLPRDPVEATHRLLHAVDTGSTRRVGLGIADSGGTARAEDTTGAVASGARWFTFNAGLGWDADVVAGVDAKRGKRTSPALYTRTAVSAYLKPPHGRPAMSLELPGEDPADVRTVFVSNTDPWSYLGSRPVHLNPTSSFDTGLGLFALRGMGMATVLRYLRQALHQGKHRGRRLIRHDDVSSVCVKAEKPVNFQVDGDLVGTRTRVEFRSVPRALTVAV
ncbi:diacylglycerol kinase family enzyme [Prauserella sediminis]|uniref:Diacylglycerol kinase family enzyme n=1 Tax=Prauserella sediminis TaxID=577680 RepID=A0A839XMF6_9PSEU|nr:diacylglycerol kinase family protein [Prauserella sediminis]MBB3663931.1 diacylglycerol kinase family enzyme [Prauserella sediminis]